MTAAQPKRPATRDGLFAWVMHRFAEVFEDHAIVKGGMALRLLDCTRETTDIDYVFVPFASKRDILPRVQETLGGLSGAAVDIQMHSTMLRAEIELDDVNIQVEVSVALSCDSVPIATQNFARRQDVPSQIVRIMAPPVALANKLGSWNERRLLHDLYDVYFFVERVGVMPDRDVLAGRLADVRSRRPDLAGVRKMSTSEFVTAIRDAAVHLDDGVVSEGLGPLLPPDELVGLALRMRNHAEPTQREAADGLTLRDLRQNSTRSVVQPVLRAREEAVLLPGE